MKITRVKKGEEKKEEGKKEQKKSEAYRQQVDMKVTEPSNPFAQPAQGDMIDDDQLLDNDVVVPSKEEEDASCSTKPRACKNCSCGRKEAEEYHLSLIL